MALIAVTGASGKLGGATIGLLLDQGVAPNSIVAMVRDPAKASALAQRGVELRRGDYTDASSLEKAFRGASQLLFISSTALGEERMLHHRNVVNAAGAAQVERILYTSAIKPSAHAKFAASPGHFHTEALIRDSGIAHTFFRNNLYLDLVPFMFGEALASGTLAHNGGSGRIGFIARQDIARALAATLALGEQARPEYSITAVAPYGLAQVAAALARASGKPITYQPLSSEEFRKAMQAKSLPPAVVEMSVALGEAIRAGEFDAASDDLGRLMGRAPVTLDAFVAQALSTTTAAPAAR